jgi:hypothetical protein
MAVLFVDGSIFLLFKRGVVLEGCEDREYISLEYVLALEAEKEAGSIKMYCRSGGEVYQKRSCQLEIT